jgi:hypothetical protein
LPCILANITYTLANPRLVASISPIKPIGQQSLYQERKIYNEEKTFGIDNTIIIEHAAFAT